MVSFPPVPAVSPCFIHGYFHLQCHWVTALSLTRAAKRLFPSGTCTGQQPAATRRSWRSSRRKATTSVWPRAARCSTRPSRSWSRRSRRRPRTAGRSPQRAASMLASRRAEKCSNEDIFFLSSFKAPLIFMFYLSPSLLMELLLNELETELIELWSSWCSMFCYDCYGTWSATSFFSRHSAWSSIVIPTELQTFRSRCFVGCDLFWIFLIFLVSQLATFCIHFGCCHEKLQGTLKQWLITDLRQSNAHFEDFVFYCNVWRWWQSHTVLCPQ